MPYVMRHNRGGTRPDLGSWYAVTDAAVTPDDITPESLGYGTPDDMGRIVCPHCSRRVYVTDMTERNHLNEPCECGESRGCYYNSNSHVGYCDACGTYCPNTLVRPEDIHHARYCGTCDTYWCSSREPNGHRCPMRIRSYSFQPAPEFKGNGAYHLGIELEISANSRDVAAIGDWADEQNVSGLFYVKEDSSVRGFEIVTHPMTPAFFERVKWGAFFDMLNSEYPTSERRSGESEAVGHGIHVHVSREAFTTPLTLARWSYLLNTHRREVVNIARREDSQWAAFSDHPVGNVLAGLPRPLGNSDRRQRDTFHSDGVPYDYPVGACRCMSCVWGWLRSSGRLQRAGQRHWSYGGSAFPAPVRYQVVNLTNSATVEVRAFRSTRKAAQFRDAVRLVYSSVDYVRSLPVVKADKSKSLSWSGLIDHAEKNNPKAVGTLKRAMAH